MEPGVGPETVTLDALVAHSKAFFAAVSTNPDYPDARRDFAREIAAYIRDEAKNVSDNRLFKTRADQKLYKDSRLEYGRAADKLLDDPGSTDLETLIGTDANENHDFGGYVTSSYDTMASMFRKLIEIEAVSDGAEEEALDAGYLQVAYRYLDSAAHALLGSAHRAWHSDVDDRRFLYNEINADFSGKLDDYRKAIKEKTRTLDALHATSDELCKKGRKVTGKEFESVLKRKADEMTGKPGPSIYG